MKYQFCITPAVFVFAISLGVVSTNCLADDGADVKREIELLRRQNETLNEQVRQQQEVIEKLNRRVGDIERTTSESERETTSSAARSEGFSFGRINISGEGGVAYFDAQSRGVFPEPSFRVDEAKLFVEAPVWEDVYFFSEINLATRESDGLNVNIGELYVDFENVSKLWGQDRTLNVRAGRMDVPFGEEYLTRDAIDNPLISHSLSDLWGVDEGVEIYGSLGQVGYVVAVQNGGMAGARDFNHDKSVAGRIYYDPNRWLHLSVSAMRTGDTEVSEAWAEIWFGGGWFKSIGSTNTTTYHANLVQTDASLKFKHGHLKAFGGYAQYDDDDTAGDNRRDFYYYAVEGLWNVTKKLYVAGRFSQIFCEDGYPLPGNGDPGYYYFNPFAPMAKELWRCSLGMGYRFSDHLVIKTEYTFEGGKEIGGGDREDVNLFAAEAAFGF